MMMSVLIKNGRIVTTSDEYVADIFIEGETISRIGKSLDVTADTVIDSTGKFVFPGGIDPHVHLELPSMGTVSSDDYISGTTAALFGGTTTVIDFVTQKRGTTLYDALNEWRKRSDGKPLCDYGFHLIVTDMNDTAKTEITPIMETEGIPSLKAFMASKSTLMMNDRQILELMYELKKHGGLAMTHATNGEMIDALIAKHRAEGNLSPLYHYLSQPEITEEEATGRFTDLAYLAGVPAYIVHLTCEGALNRVKNASKRNQKVYAETCIQYLLLDASVYGNDFDGAKYVMSPPLREKKDQAALWAGINDGSVRVVATDHCPFTWQQKLRGKDDFSKIPNGSPGIEHRMELLFSEGVKKGRISLNKFVEVTSTNAAKIFGLYPKKGCIAVGSDADLLTFDPEKEHTLSAATHHMNVDYSCYEGWNVTGKVQTVLMRGKVAIEHDAIYVKPGYGKYLKRKTIKETISL
jgi:dihydropyrimidinase